MAQVAQNAPISDLAQLPGPTPFQVAFAGAFEAFSALVTSHALVKVDAKASSDALNTAERSVSWAAFDLAATDLEMAQSLAVSIATAKGVKAEGIPVYRQRARDAIAYRVAIGKADRAKVNPYTLAKQMRAKANETAATASANAPFVEEALSMAAGELQTTVPALQALIMAGDSEGRTLFDAALVEVKGRISLIEEYNAIMERMANADPATRVAVGLPE